VKQFSKFWSKCFVLESTYSQPKIVIPIKVTNGLITELVGIIADIYREEREIYIEREGSGLNEKS